MLGVAMGASGDHSLFPVLMLRIKGFQAAEPLIGVASGVVGCSVLLFAWLVFARIGARVESQSTAMREIRAP